MEKSSSSNRVWSWSKSLSAVILCSLLSWQTAAANSQQQQPVLTDGRHELKGGESHSYAINLTAGQFLYALVEQQGIDVKVTWFRPDGSEIAASDKPNGRWGPESVLLVAEVSGEYRIEVRAPNSKANAANYQIKIMALREATAVDKGHVLAQQIFEEAQTLRSRPTVTDKRAAVVKYQEATPLLQAAGDTYLQTLNVQAMGVAYAQLSEFRTALRSFEDALSLAQKITDERLEVSIQNLLGGMNDVLGEIIKSRQHYERARLLASRLNDNINEGSALNNIGKLYNESGDFQRAIDYYLEALPLLADQPARRARTLSNIGMAYSDMGATERALDYLQQSLAILKNGPDRTAESQTLSNIGFVNNRAFKFQEAFDYYGQARAMQQKIGDRGQEAETLDLLGANYADMGQPEKAVEYHQQALEIQRVTKNVRREAISLNYLGHVYGLLGQPEKALGYFAQALSIFRNIGDLSSVARALEERARVEQQLGDLTKARTDIEESLSLIETVRARSGSQQYRASYLASREKAYEFYVDLLMQLHAKEPLARHDAEALQARERGRARSLLEMLNEAHVDIEQGVSADLVTRERDIRQLINAKAQSQIQLTAQNSNRQEIETLNKEIRALEDEYQQVQVAIRNASPAYAALTQPQPL
ncbi:MAG TPA: tetratricopeptide repeat protein, partial [Pyrinomonadaceae bacterium]|nr:tetratricopeptide repeat protein [Pyrinomonadaceae bacterium]